MRRASSLRWNRILHRTLYLPRQKILVGNNATLGGILRTFAPPKHVEVQRQLVDNINTMVNVRMRNQVLSLLVVSGESQTQGLSADVRSCVMEANSNHQLTPTSNSTNGFMCLIVGYKVSKIYCLYIAS